MTLLSVVWLNELVLLFVSASGFRSADLYAPVSIIIPFHRAATIAPGSGVDRRQAKRAAV